MRIPGRLFIVAPFCLALMYVPAPAQMILRSSVIGAGAAAATDGHSFIAGTIGQTIIGPVSNGTGVVGQGFWYTLPVSSSSGVSAYPAVDGQALVMYQNFPNPFSTSTEIAFDMPKSGHVSLKVIDAMGHEVSTLIDEVREAGRITTMVDAGRMESGYYSARLVANGVTRTIMMVLVR